MSNRRTSILLTAALCAACGPGLEPTSEVEAQAQPGRACSTAKRAELLERATAERPQVVLDCAIALGPTATITKRVVIQGDTGSGAVLDCGGGAIAPAFDTGYALAVRSLRARDGTWRRPEDVTVRSCKILGPVRVWGLGVNGEAPDVRASSRSPGHTARAQAAAPTRVLLEDVAIETDRGIPLYVSPGVTELTLSASEISGNGPSVSIYLDAESARNTIADSYIHHCSDGRELIAVDGSAGNRISGNRFSCLQNGGIYVYRNCGEGGTVRHQTPVRNEIVGNTFFYRRYRGSSPAVWLASRNATSRYCDDDAGFPFGSSADDRDLARDNVVAGNGVFVRRPSEMLRADDAPNLLTANVTVDEQSAARIVPGCVVWSEGASPVYLAEGQRRGRLTCRGGVPGRSLKLTPPR